MKLDNIFFMPTQPLKITIIWCPFYHIYGIFRREERNHFKGDSNKLLIVITRLGVHRQNTYTCGKVGRYIDRWGWLGEFS